MIDFHVHPLSIKNAKDYMISISKTHPGSSVSFANHFFMYPYSELKLFGMYNNINVIQSFGIKTEEGIEFIIQDPNKKAKDYLKYISNIKCHWICMIIDLLLDKGINIHPGLLLKYSGKKIYELELYDIAVEVGNPIYKNPDCESVDVALKVHIHDIVSKYKMMKPTIEHVSPIFDDNQSYMVCPEDETLLDKIDNNTIDLLSGYIYNGQTPTNILEQIKCKDPRYSDKKWYTGSNSWI